MQNHIWADSIRESFIHFGRDVVESSVGAAPFRQPKADGSGEHCNGDDGQMDVDADVGRIEEGNGRSHRLNKLENGKGRSAIVGVDAAEDADDLRIETRVPEGDQEAAQDGKECAEIEQKDRKVGKLRKILTAHLLVMKAVSWVSPKVALSGMLRKMMNKPKACVRKPRRMTGSRPNRLVLLPKMPKTAPPTISPTPMKMPDRPTSFLLSSNSRVKPMLGLYTPLKKENSIPAQID